MITEQRKHEDFVNREKLTKMIRLGAPCKYSYTHYAPSGKPTDETKDITKEEALAFMVEKSDKRDDGYRFSPSRCFLYGHVRRLVDNKNDNQIFILFSEADRKPTTEEIIAYQDKYGVR